MPKLKEISPSDRLYHELLEMRRRLNMMIKDYESSLPTEENQEPPVYLFSKKRRHIWKKEREKMKAKRNSG
jgi:hypothetical protein